jgi:hypothetical protein
MYPRIEDHACDVNVPLNINCVLPTQGDKRFNFELEVWNKTEDVVQTLLQVRLLIDLHFAVCFS